MIIVGIALHGMCYDFFFVTGFIYTDKKASKNIRGQAQGLLVLITQGLGLGIGAYLTGEYFNKVRRRSQQAPRHCRCTRNSGGCGRCSR